MGTWRGQKFRKSEISLHTGSGISFYFWQQQESAWFKQKGKSFKEDVKKL